MVGIAHTALVFERRGIVGGSLHAVGRDLGFVFERKQLVQGMTTELLIWNTAQEGDNKFVGKVLVHRM